MNRTAVVRAYLAAMATGDLGGVVACFTSDGRVTSPVYGGVPVGDFYRRLFADTVAAEVDLLDIYTSESGDRLAAHFDYRWERTDGTRTACALIDLFEFAADSALIDHITIVFDTARIGKAD